VPTRDLENLNILITAGPTREKLDPVRFISNFSSGKMGYSIAQKALERGANVRLISGPVALAAPEGAQLISIESTLDLLDAALANAAWADIVIQSAAPADYRPETVAPQKMKKAGGEGMTIKLVENPDVAATIGKNKRLDQVFCVFAAETENGVANARGKMQRKNADMIVLNDVTKPGAGFLVDTNIATIITGSSQTDYPMMSKSDLADIILTTALGLKNA